MVPLGCMSQNFTRRSKPCSNLVEMKTEWYIIPQHQGPRPTWVDQQIEAITPWHTTAYWNLQTSIPLVMCRVDSAAYQDWRKQSQCVATGNHILKPPSSCHPLKAFQAQRPKSLPTPSHHFHQHNAPLVDGPDSGIIAFPLSWLGFW